MTAATTGNLFYVSAIFTQKALWDVLRFIEAHQGYSVEVRPVAPPTGLLEAPQKEAAATSPPALFRRQRNSESGKIRDQIVAALLEHPESEFDTATIKTPNRHTVTNAIFFLNQHKFIKKTGHQTYKATAKLINAGKGE